MTTMYTYGTKPPMDEYPGIRAIRFIADDYLNGNMNSVFITSHANQRMGERKILPNLAIESISKGFYVEYQDVKGKQEKSDCTVFYSGHDDQILSVNTIADLRNQIIKLVTVENLDTSVWNIVGDYVERK